VHIFVKSGSILFQTKTKMISHTLSSTFHRRKCFVFLIFCNQ